MIQMRCQDLSAGYERSTVFNGLDFKVESGDYLTIAGENGSGKSTLLKVILGLIPAKSGSIVFENGMSRKDIGYLPQQKEIQKDFPASVEEVVLSGCLSKLGTRPFYNRKEKLLAYNKMEQLGIESLRKKSYRNLSGGQQQRVLLARALCATDQMLILDEPTNGLDPVVTNDFYTLLAKLNRESGITIIMVSHDLGNAIRYSNKILQLSEDENFFGTISEYRNRTKEKTTIGGVANV